MRRLLSWDAASVVAFAVLFGLVLATFADYGITWDERSHVDYGDRLHAWYRSGFAFTRAIDTVYGGGFDLVGAAFRRALAPMDSYDALHLLGGLVGLLGLVAAWKLGRLLFGPAGGFATLVILALTPSYYGHMFNNPKDAPFAAAYLWVVYYLVRIARALPAPGWTLWLRLGLATGLAISVRIAGLLGLCYLAAVAALYLAGRWYWSRSGEQTFWTGARLAAGGAVATVAAWLVAMPLWPWILYHPVHRPLEALGTMSNFTAHVRTVPFGDATYRTTDVPWDYLPRYFAIKLPELVVLLLVVGLVAGAVTFARDLRRPERLGHACAALAVGLALLFPPLYAIAKGSALYDALRHFLFLTGPIAVVAGGTAVGLVRIARARHRLAGAAVVAVLAVGAGWQVARNAALHPQQYTFYNGFVGGLAGVGDRYETDYYGASYKEALRGLRDQLWRTERTRYLSSRYVIKGCLPLDSETVLPSNFGRRISKAAPADFWVGHTRGGCHLRHGDAPVIQRVVRDGATLSVIRDLRPPELAGDGPWLARYWFDRRFRGEPVARWEPAPGSRPLPDRGYPADLISARWQSCLVLRDPLRLRVDLAGDGTLFVDRLPVLSGDELVLPAGVHAIRVDAPDGAAAVGDASWRRYLARPDRDGRCDDHAFDPGVMP